MNENLYHHFGIFIYFFFRCRMMNKRKKICINVPKTNGAWHVFTSISLTAAARRFLARYFAHSFIYAHVRA